MNLNHYLFTMNIIKSKHGSKCTVCNVQETIDRFLINYSGVQDETHQKLHKNNVDYDKCRHKLRKELRKTTLFLKIHLISILLICYFLIFGKDEFMVEKEAVIGIDMERINVHKY